jgi:hypothetical protein
LSKDAQPPAACQLVRRPGPLPSIIPARGITLLTGAPNVGKTALLAGLAQRFRDNQPIFGHQPTKLPAIGIIIADRSWEDGAADWFERAGFSDIRHYCMADDPFFNPKQLRRKFDRTDKWAEFVDRLKLPPCSLLLTDPISLFLGGNLNDYDSCAVACHEIRLAIRQRDLSLIATAHTAKIKADIRARYLRAQDQILGSTALLGFSDTQMYLASPEETGRSTYTFAWAPHQAPPETFDLVRTSTGLFEPVKASARSSGTQQRVLDLIPLDGGTLTLKEITDLALSYPLSEKTVRRDLNQLQAEGKVERLTRGVYRRAPFPAD